jgi:hypothetical protein
VSRRAKQAREIERAHASFKGHAAATRGVRAGALPRSASACRLAAVRRPVAGPRSRSAHPFCCGSRLAITPTWCQPPLPVLAANVGGAGVRALHSDRGPAAPRLPGVRHP